MPAGRPSRSPSRSSMPSVTRAPLFQSGGSTPSRLCTKKSKRLRSPYTPPEVWSAPGITSRSNCLFALISAFTTCMVEDGSTFVSSSPTTSSSLPCSLYALSTFDEAAYCGPMRPAHPLLVPPDLVHAIVVAAGSRERHLVELRMEEQRAQRVLSARRCAVDADARDVVPGVLRRHRLVPQDAIGEAGIAQVLARRHRGTPSSDSPCPCRRSARR